MKFKSGSGKVSESERTGGNGGGGDRKVVVVGVKLERRSRELLTWSLMKVAQPGDLVIALHVVLHASSGEQSSLLSLMNTFDSVFSVYEGFCHLKQMLFFLKENLQLLSFAHRVLTSGLWTCQSATLAWFLEF